MAFDVTLQLNDVPWERVRVVEYRFDKDNNSYYHLGRQLRDRPNGQPPVRTPTANEAQQLIAGLESDDPAAQIAAVKKAVSFGKLPAGVLTAALKLYEKTDRDDVRTAIRDAAGQVQTRQECYSADQVTAVRELSQLAKTKAWNRAVGNDGTLQLPLAVAGNGANVVHITPLRPQ